MEMSAAPPEVSAIEKDNLRFAVELEFVQCLGNAKYLTHLAQNGYLKKKEFVNYLKYLLYWKDTKYAKYIKFPICLNLLELLQHESFRDELNNPQCSKYIDDQILLHWQHYTRRRVQLHKTFQEQFLTRQRGANNTANSSIGEENDNTVSDAKNR